MAKLDVVIPAVEVEVNGVRYRKVDREAKAGDIVKMTEGGRDVTNGAFYEVASAAGYLVFRDDDDDSRILVVWSHDVYERVTVPMKTARLTVGDYAKITDTIHGHEYNVGEIVKIVTDDGSDLPYVGETHDKRSVFADWFAPSECEPATEAEFNAQKKPDCLKVGEYAKVTADNYEHCAGHFVQITGYTSGTFDYAVKRITLGGTGYIAHKNIVRVTEAEVEAAKKKAEEEAARKAEEANWAKIGRKVGEIKEGDVVRSLGFPTNIPKGTFGIAEYGHNFVCPCMGVRDASGKLWSASGGSGLELIVPVEQRFDTKEAA